MANPQQTIQRSFSAGELTPSMHARADQVKYVTGLRRCRNFIVKRAGGVDNRPGTRFVGLTKTTSIVVGLFKYVSENRGESVLWEMGTTYLRPYLNGARLEVVIGSINPYGGAIDYKIGDLVVSGGIIYYSLADQTGVAPPGATWVTFTGDFFELPNPFAPDLPNVAQSGRTLTLTHKLHAPYELINAGSTTAWVLRKMATVPSLAAPVGLAVVPGAAGALSIGYVVTGLATDTLEETVAGAQVINLLAAVPTNAAPDKLTWTALTGAGSYGVYCDIGGNGIYGFIGLATSNKFTNNGIIPDYTVTPPTNVPAFAAAGDFPDRSAEFQQRRFMGFTINAPDGIFASRTGLPSNFGISEPLQNDDALTFRIAGNNHNPVRHLVALKNFIALTGGGAWIINGGQDGTALTPSSLAADQFTYTGVGDPVPVKIGNAIIYVEDLGSRLFDLQFEQQVEGLSGRDLCIFSDHLFKGFTVDELDYAQNPDSIVWCCRSDGTLLGLTYIREQDVWGWHRHDSGASCRFEHVCVVPEALGDTVYFITRRTIGGVFQRQIEKLEPRTISNFNVECFFVDCGLSYHGAPVNNVAGLGHLNGQIVAVVGDGDVIFDGDPAGVNAANFTVTAGTFPANFAASYSDIHVGIPIRFAELELLDLDVQGSDARGKKKRVEGVRLILESSSRSFKAGPDTANLVPLSLEPSEAQADQFTGNVELTLTNSFNDNGRVFIRHTDPLPLTILGILPNTELGG